MKRVLGILVCASVASLLVFGLSSFVLSQETVAVEETQEADSISGKIVSIDTTESTIVIESVDEEDQAVEVGEFQLDEESEILQGDTEISLTELKAGDQVSAVYVEDEEGNMIIDVLKK